MANDYIMGPDVEACWTEQDGNDNGLRATIQECRDLLAGRLIAPLDESILPGPENSSQREALRVSTPTKYVESLKLLNALSKKCPEPKREQAASGVAAEQHATSIERAAKAGMDQLYPRAAVLDNLLNEGQCATLVMPVMAHWDSLPYLYEGDNPDNAIRSIYSVDSKGRARDDPWYGEPSRKYKEDASKSAAYFKGRESDYRARHIPVVIEAISRLNGIPIGLRRVGNQYEMDAFVERRSFTASSLIKKGYRWDRGEGQQLTETNDRMGDHHLYGYWGYCEGRPYVSYCVDGMKTWRDGSDQSDGYVIDLGKQYGLQRLPISYQFGWSFPGVVDQNERGVPFVHPFGRSWLNLDTLLTMLLVRAYRASNMFLLYKPDSELLKVLGITGDVPMPPIKASTATPILGDLQSPPDMSLPEVAQVIAMLSQSMQGQEPSPDALGSNKGISGYARNVAQEDALGVFQQVQDADLSLYAQTASRWLELAAKIGEQHGNLWVFTKEELPQQGANGRVARAKLEIKPELFDGDFDVTAEYPTQMGDNLALTQQLMEAHQKGELPQEIVLEKGWGFSNPEEIVARNEAEKARNTPLGQAKLMMWSAKIAGDEEEAAVMEALANQELMKLMPDGPNTVQNTMPAAGAMAGVPPPPNMTGVGMPNIGASALGGVVQGQMQTGPEVMAGMAQGAPNGQV